MAHETVWIKTGKKQVALPRPGARVVTPEGMLLAKVGDMMEKDEDGQVWLIRKDDAEDARKKYDAGVAKLAKAG